MEVIGRAMPGAVIGDIPPENILTPRDIRAYGVGTVAELLDELALQTTSGQSRDGAGPVVLVNGRRISGINEVGDLPTEAILRVDILPEEVALKYGYSSDQKVVNVILRRRFAAKTGEGSAGQSTDGGNGRARGNGSLTRIEENRRLNVAVGAQVQDSITEAQRDITPVTGSPAADPAYHTLQPRLESYTGNAVFATPLTDTISASTNLAATHTNTQSLNGLAASAPFAPLEQLATSTTVHLGSTLNMDVPMSWRISMIGAYDYSDSNTDSDTGFTTQKAHSTTNAASASLLATRNLLKTPAGSMLLSLQGGFQQSGTHSGTEGRLLPPQSLSRTSSNVRVSLDLPITRRGTPGGAIGTLTANLNSGVTWVSQFDALTTFGYGLNWSPTQAVSVITAISEDRRAPSVQQLVSPTVTTVGTPVYDYATGESVLVTSTTGGNPLLVADDRRTFKLGATVKPFSSHNFTLTANYSESRTTNAIQSFSGISPSLESAFPFRYVRDEDGVLVAVDTRPANVASQEKSSLRWGFNLTQVLRQPQRPRFRARPRPPAQPPADGAGSDMPPTAQSPEPGVQPAGAPAVVGDLDRTPDDGTVPARPQGGTPARNPGFGRGPGGGQSGGPGGGGGRFGRSPGGFGGDDGAQLQLSVYDTLLFRDQVTLRSGLEPVDLLEGGTLGGPPPVRQQVEMNGGVTDNGIGIRLTGEWRSAGRTIDSTGGTGDLHFSALATLNLRLFADLGQRLPAMTWARGLRVTFALQNLLNNRQDVTNNAGVVPPAYQPGYLDPAGRTVQLAVRKIM